MTTIRSFIAGLALGLPAAAFAQTPNLAASTYVGVQLGTGKVELNCRVNTPCSPVDTSYSVRAGYRFDASWAFEVTYTKIDADWGLFGSNYSAEFGGFGVGAAYSVPLSPSVGVVFRAGISSNELKLQPAVVPFSQNPGTITTRSIGPYAGLGASWQFARHWSVSLNADWTRADLRDAPTSAKQGATVRTLGAGIAFNF